MARDKKPEEAKAGVAPWMATYGDMITLLMCFFVMLYSMSNVDMEKYNDFAESMSKSYSTLDSAKKDGVLEALGSGVMDMPAAVTESEDDEGVDRTSDKEYEDRPEVSDKYEEAQVELVDIADVMQTYVIQNQLDDIVNIERNEMEVVVRFQDSILFDTAKATLREEAFPALDALADVMSGYPDSDITIEGHADNRAINTPQYPNNRYLSSARALEVMAYFVDVKGFSEETIIASGRGAAIPIADNSTEEGRAQNRRVEIKIKSKQYSG